MEIRIDELDYEWLMIDASHCKVHPHAAGAKGDNQDMSLTKGLKTKPHLVVDSHGMPIRIIVTEGATADCTQARILIEGLTAEYLLADKGYDSNDIIDQAIVQGMKPVIPAKKNRTAAREYDKELYDCVIWLRMLFCI